MPIAAALLSKIICRFRRDMAMSGIAARLSHELKFSEVIFAEQTWNYTTGKLTLHESGVPEVRPETRLVVADCASSEPVGQMTLPTRSSHSNSRLPGELRRKYSEYQQRIARAGFCQ